MPKKVCVVTGASRGIGLATAIHFAEAGYDIVAAARSAGPLEAAARQIEEAGAACEALPVDISTAAGAAELVDVAKARFGRLDVLVNNAGVAPLAPVAEMQDDAFRGCLDVNCAAVFYLTRAAWPLLKSRGGVIVNLSSVAAQDPFPGFAVYGACKSWVNAFTSAIAKEGHDFNIRVYAVGPGGVETEMLREHFPDFPAEQTIEPQEVARMVLAMCDPGFARVSGQTIYLTN